MRKFWIVENGNVVYIGILKQKRTDPKEEKKEIAKAIIKALKEAKKQ
jgi:hypothetical protein